MSDKLDQAKLAVRGTWLTKLTDRTFLSMLGAAGGTVTATVALWQTTGVPVTDKVNATIVAFVAVAGVVGAWNASEKAKDAAVWKTALQPEPAANLAVGNVAGNLNEGATDGLQTRLPDIPLSLPAGGVAMMGGFGELVEEFHGDEIEEVVAPSE